MQQVPETKDILARLLGGAAILICFLLTLAITTGKVHAADAVPPDTPTNVEVKVDESGKPVAPTAEQSEVLTAGQSGTSADTESSTPSDSQTEAGHWYDPVVNAYDSAKAKVTGVFTDDEPTPSSSPADAASSVTSESEVPVSDTDSVKN